MSSISFTLNIDELTIKAKIYKNNLTIMVIQYHDSTSTIITQCINKLDENKYPNYVKVAISLLKTIISELSQHKDDLIKIAESSVFYTDDYD